MAKNELNVLYFDWVCDLVDSSMCKSYKKLLNRLHEIDFTYIIPMDDNRAEDGIDLRYRFGDENDIESYIIANELDYTPCSVLEMMIALAVRCEEHIMGNSDIGDRTAKWFWTMVDNLGLMGMNDGRFDEEYVDDVIFRFLDREYERNGRGGLFIVDTDKDLRTVEIWYQMCWYLNEEEK